MRTIVALSLILCVLSAQTSGLTTFKTIRRGAISDSVKQLALPNAEVDPNVAPLSSAADVSESVDDVSEPETNEIKNPAEETEVADEAAPSGNGIATSGSGGGGAAAGDTNDIASPLNEDDKNPINRYCKCSESHCDCCRNFALPIIPVRGPGCARVSYLGNEKIAVTIKYGDIVLASRTISGKNTKPVCVGLPGGYSRFCGRVYGLSKSEENFKACLGLELRAEDEVEASLRVSCFKFGPRGLAVAEAEPLPAVEAEKEEEEDDDFFGLGGGDDIDDYTDDDGEDDDDEAVDDDDEDDGAEDDDDDDDDTANDQTDPDYDGFSLLGEELFDESAESESTAPAASRQEPLAELAPAETAAAPAPATPASPVAPTKKPKKKKKNSSSDDDYAFDLLNGIFEFFS